jgi:aromatic ring-opening dioxygenase catalytic subunit (LigB family)
MTATTSPTRLPTFYIPHGGGPCFFMDTPPGLPKDMWTQMAAFLRGFDAALGVRPKALLIVSGHWETPIPTVNSGEHPPLLFDYYGFPEHTYQLTYPAPGAPQVAARIRAVLEQLGAPTAEDRKRGYDHGVFIPFKLMYPNADIPIVQMALLNNLDAANHIALGRALAPLRDEGVLIVGSGMSYHNLRLAFHDHPPANKAAVAFDDWLTQASCNENSNQRDAALCEWFKAPGSLESHPRPEHLLPLMVAAGAAMSDRGQCVFKDTIIGKPVSAFRFG